MKGPSMFRRKLPSHFHAPMAYALLAFAAPGLAAPAAPSAAASAAPQVRNLYVRLNAVPGRPAAGYMTIIAGAKDDKLVSVTAPGARIEMHSTIKDGGTMKMVKLDSVRVDGGMGVHFDPGGNHLMIFGLKGTPKSVPMTFSFASGAKVEAVAEVRAAGADPHAGH
jgi:periplasmic copper chaperone A